MTSDILTRTQPPIQCVRTSFLASFASSASKKNMFLLTTNDATECFAQFIEKKRLRGHPSQNHDQLHCTDTYQQMRPSSVFCLCRMIFLFLVPTARGLGQPPRYSSSVVCLQNQECSLKGNFT